VKKVQGFSEKHARLFAGGLAGTVCDSGLKITFYFTACQAGGAEIGLCAAILGAKTGVGSA
jgi:hypothetical protein